MSDVVSPNQGDNVISKSSAADQRVLPHDDWQAIENDSEFRELVRKKRSFIIPATVFFLVYYFAFLFIVGYFPAIANVNVIGYVNVAYLFALSQFVMVWVLMYLYIRRAGIFDALAQRIISRIKGGTR